MDVVLEILGHHLFGKDLVLDLLLIDQWLALGLCHGLRNVASGVCGVFFVLLRVQDDTSVHGLLVDHLDLTLSLVVDWLEYGLLVVLLTFNLHLLEDLLVVGLDLIMQELLSKCESLDFFLVGHVDESRFSQVEHVVITDDLWSTELLADVLLLSGYAVDYKTEAYADSAFNEEVHLRNLVFLVVNEAVLF